MWKDTYRTMSQAHSSQFFVLNSIPEERAAQG